MRPKSYGSSTIGVKKSTVCTIARSSRHADDAGVVGGVGGRRARAGRSGRGRPATIGRRSAADSLQPQPAPWEREVKGVAAAVAAADGGHDARDAVEKVWQPIEGTVKRSEPDLYLDVEDSFELLANGDAADAKRGAQRLGRAVDAYLAKHPG
jgi:hypothetical protein